MDDEFLGYCLQGDETYPAPVHLNGVDAVRSYITLQVPIQHRVIICDSDDFRVFESQDGKILFP